MAGQRPDLKIALKPKSGDGERLYLLAFWRRENGKLSGDIDRKIRGMRIVLEDGTHVDVRRGPDNKLTHWLDAFEGDGQSGERSSSGQRGYSGGSGADFPPDDFGDDDIPF